jgi:nucleoside-diphosphate-sugar epimerase
VALRFSNILDADDYARIPSHLGDPTLRKWNLWSYIDLRDAAAACRVALEAQVDGATSFIIVARDTVMTTPSAELVRRVFPSVGSREEIDEFGSLMSGRRAAETLGFVPQHSWRDSNASE